MPCLGRRPCSVSARPALPGAAASPCPQLKARLSEANKEIQAQMVANARKVNELQQENAKLLAQKGADGGLRYKAPAAVSGTQGTGSGFTPLFLILATLIAYVMGVYTTLMTLPK